MNASENKIIDAINFAWTKQKAINYNIKKMFNSFKINKGIFWGERLKNGSYKIWYKCFKSNITIKFLFYWEFFKKMNYLWL